MTLVHKEGVLETGPIRIKRKIFQGDSLSPLLFTMSLNPVNQELQNTGYGYQLDEQTKINHLFYVDDLKLYGTSDKQLTGLINTVNNVSDDIKMEFGLDKYAKASFKRGKKVSAVGIPLDDNQVIQDLDKADTYKYLGMEEGEGIQHHKMKVLRHQNSKALHSVPKEAEKYLTEAGRTDDMTNDHGKTATLWANQLKLKYKEDFKKIVRDK